MKEGTTLTMTHLTWGREILKIANAVTEPEVP